MKLETTAPASDIRPGLVTGPPKRFDVERVRGDFPILGRRIRGRDLVYLDNAATAQKPQAVIDAVTHFYAHENANVHRGVHYMRPGRRPHSLSERGTHTRWYLPGVPPTGSTSWPRASAGQCFELVTRSS
jgi:hypothetical protein